MTFTDVPAIAVGAPGWYLDRPGSTWGGMSVAAVWYGGAQALADSLLPAARRREPDQIALATIGADEIALHQALTALEHALGPGSLTQNKTHARRVANLSVYIRQHHAERHLAVLGRHLVDAGDAERPFRTPL